MKVVGYDIGEIAEAARIAKAAVDDLADSLAIAHSMAARLFG